MNQFGRYKDLKEIGRGGFATVYKSHDSKLNRAVVLKVLHAGYTSDPNFVERFHQEAQTVAGFQHPNIVTIYDFGEEDRQLFIAMEYLSGGDFQVWLNNRKDPLTVEESLPILQPIASALDYAHKQGVVHRDIKPSNIMFQQTGDNQRVLLTDFGLVKAIEGTIALTMTNQMLGSPEYMAPEQAELARNDEIGPATDLYAFGIVAYQMIAGRVPFPGHSLSVLNAHVNSPAPSPQDFNNKISPEVARILLKMLSKAPADRYENATFFVDALQEVMFTATQNQKLEAEVSGLYKKLEIANNNSEWAEVIALSSQIEMLIPDYCDVVKFHTTARQSLQNLQESATLITELNNQTSLEANSISLPKENFSQPKLTSETDNIAARSVDFPTDSKGKDSLPSHIPKRGLPVWIIWGGFIFSLIVAIGIGYIISNNGSNSVESVEVTRVVEVPGPEVESMVEVEVPIEVEVTREVGVMMESGRIVSAKLYEEAWASSAHADASAEAFVHWNEDDPQEVPVNCAKCHSTPGYMDFTGADGSEMGVVDAPAPIGTVIECDACHNDIISHKDSVIFPSGAEISSLDASARCMECHQGRASTVSVNAGIEEAGLDPVEDADTVSEEVGFSNVHYYAAAATQYGTKVMGGYEYDGKSYDAKFDHVEGFDSCVSCHDSHTLAVKVEECSACHEGVVSSEDFANIRMAGSLVDYNGNGDIEEGIQAEIAGLRNALIVGMQAYATEVSGTPIAYNSAAYPYFFIDGDGDGETSEEEAIFTNAYNAWTPRLAKAAYNYQASLKDPGNFAHGGKYTIQLLYDSLENINMSLATPIDMAAMNRIDHGHFAGSKEAFRHWGGEEDGDIVPASCSKCHSAAGLPLLATEGVSTSQPASNGLNCATCHNDLATYELYTFEDVTFPSGATVTMAMNEADESGLESNTCINCHQGRSSTVGVNQVIGNTPDDEVGELFFQNVHYFAAGATLFGNQVQGAYQYEGKEYAGRNEHVSKFDSCTECHSTHALEVEVEECTECHENVMGSEDLVAIRVSEADYDGDGDVEEGIDGEIETITEILYASIQAYAANNANTDAIVYDSHAYPYFFVDANGDGESSPDEANYGGRYVTWTPELLRAAYNYQYAQKDPGAFAHNAQYVMQTLYDSIEAVGGDTTGMTRP